MDNEPKKPGHRFNQSDTTARQVDETTVSADEHQRTVTALERERGRRRSRPLLVILLSLLLIGLGAAAALYVYTQNTNRDKQQTAAVTPEPTEQRQTAQSVVDEVRPLISDPQDVDENNFPSVPLRIDGYDYWVMINDDDKVAGVQGNISTDEGNPTIINRINGRLAELGLKTTVAPEATEPTYADYVNDNVVCQLSTLTEDNDATVPDTISVTCVDRAEYPQVAAAMKPFYDVYREARGEQYTKDLVLSRLEIEKSPIEDYRNASVVMGGIIEEDGKTRIGIGGSVALFYQTPDEKWHYFTNSQNILACDRFNTDDLRRAYADTKCFDNRTQNESTVQKP